MPTRARMGYMSGRGEPPLDYPAPAPVPATHQSNLFPSLPKGDLEMWGRGRTSPVRRKAWPAHTHGSVVYPPTETIVETVVPMVGHSPATPVQDATNDHLKTRLELIEAQMDMLRNTSQDETFMSYKARGLHDSHDSYELPPEPRQETPRNTQELDNLKKEVESKKRLIKELTSQLEEARRQLASTPVNDDLIADLKAKLAEERQNLDDLRQRHKEMLSSALDDINAANQKLANQEEKLDAYKAQLAGEQRAANQRLASQEEKFDAYKAQLAGEQRAANQKLANQEEKLEAYKAQLAGEQRRADGLERERDSLKARGVHEAALEDELAKANDDIRKAKKRLYEMQEALEKAEHGAAEQERVRRRGEHFAEAVERLEVELVKVKQDATAKDDEIRKARSELQAAIRAHGDANGEVEIMKERMKHELANAARKADQQGEERARMLEDEIKRLRAEAQKQEARRLEGEEEKRRGSDEEMRRLRAELQRSETKRVETEESRRVAQQKLEDAEDSLQKLKRAGDRLKDIDSMHNEATGKVHELERTNRSLFDQLETCKYECQRERDQAAAWKAELDKLKPEAARLKVESEDAKADAEHAKMENNRMAGALAKLKSANKELQEELEHIKNHAAKARSTNGQLGGENERMKLEAEAGKKELERLTNELNKHRTEVDALRLDNANHKSDVSKYKHEAEVLQTDLDRLKQQLRTAAQPQTPALQPAQTPLPVNPPSQPQPVSPSNVQSNHIVLPTAPGQAPPPLIHPSALMLSGEEEIMRIGCELRKALRTRDDAMSELESLAKQLGKSKRQHELAQQELETSEAKLLTTKRQADDLKDELESTITQLTRARTTAQDALAEADASGRMLNEARRIADEARDRLQQETQRFQRESEAAEQAWNEAIAASDDERAEVERKLEAEEERSATLAEKLDEFQQHSDDLNRQLEHMQEVLRAEGEIAQQRLQAQQQQLTDARNEQLRELENRYKRELDQLQEAHKEELHEAIKEVNDMKEMLSTSVQEKSQMQTSFEQQLDSMRQNLREADSDNTRLRDDVARATHERDNVADELVATQLALAKIQDHSSLKEQEGNELSTRLTDTEDRYRMDKALLEQEVMKLRAEADAQSLAERGHAEALTEVHKCYEEVSIEAKQLREMLAVSNAENEEAARVIRDAQDKTASMHQQLEVLLKSKEEVTERLVGAENTIAEMQKEIMHAVEKYEEKKSELAATRYDLDTRNTELEQLSVKYLSASSELTEVRQQNAQLSSELNRLQAEAESLKQSLVQASIEVDEAKHTRSSDRSEVGRLRQLEERAVAELEEADQRLTEALTQETALRKELRACQDKIARHDLACEALEAKLGQEALVNEQLARDQEATSAALNETVRKLRLELERCNADMEALALKEETAARRLQDVHRLHESKEKALQEDVMTERHARAELEEQLSTARKQYRQARREVTLSSEEAEQAREEAEELAQQRLRKYKQDLEDALREKDRLLDEEAALKAELHKYFMNEEATFRHLYSTKEELHRLDMLASFERIASDHTLAHHIQFAAGNDKDMKLALDSQTVEILQKNEELHHIYAQLEESNNNSLQAKLSNDALSQQIKLLQTDQGGMDQLVKKYEDKLAECNTLKGELHSSHNSLQELTGEVNRSTQQFETREQELMRANADLDAAVVQKSSEADGLKQEVLRLQREWNHSTTGLESERTVAQTLKDELEISKRELVNTRDRLTNELKNMEASSQQNSEAERRKCVTLQEDLAGLQDAHRAMAARCTLLTALAEAVVSDKPADGIGRLTWRLNVETEPQLGGLLGAACENMSKLYQLEDGAKGLSAGFDFICATRDTLIRELGSCKKAVFEAWQEASRLMEELLRAAGDKGSRDSCGRLCASLGGLRSQLMWIVLNCLSQEERGIAGVHGDDDVGGTIKHLRKTTLPLDPVTPEIRPNPTPTTLSSAIKHRAIDARHLVSPVPSRSSDTDLHSCYGSDDGRSQPPTTPRPASSLPKTPKKARVVAPDEVDRHVISPNRR